MPMTKFSYPPSIADLLRKDQNPWEPIDSDATTITEASISTLSAGSNFHEEVAVVPPSLTMMGTSDLAYPPSSPAHMGWNNQSSSHQSHIPAITYTGLSTSVRAELSVIPPCPATDSYYQVAFYEKAGSVYAGEEEDDDDGSSDDVVISEKKKDKKEKKKILESKRSPSESQAPRSEHNERRHSMNGLTLDTKGEHNESHERRKQEEEERRNRKEMKNAEHRRSRRERREQRRSSDSSHSGDGSSNTADDKHLNKHPTAYGPLRIPENGINVASFAQAQSNSHRRLDTTKVDCDRLLMQLLNAQREILEGATASSDATHPELHPLIATWDRDFQEAFDVLARDSVLGDNFDNSFTEFCQKYLVLSPCGEDDSMNEE